MRVNECLEWLYVPVPFASLKGPFSVHFHHSGIYAEGQLRVVLALLEKTNINEACMTCFGRLPAAQRPRLHRGYWDRQRVHWP